MEVKNDNKPGEKPGIDPNPVIVPGDQPSGGTTAQQPASPAKPKFPEPEVLQAVVDPTERPKQGPTPFSFTTPQAVHQNQAQPTKGDVARAQEPAPKTKTLAELDAEIASETKNEKERTYDDYHDTAVMFIEGWEAALTFAARMISKDTSDSTYEFGEAKRLRLIDQATKVSRKKDWVMPIELLFLGTLLPASATILLKAVDKKKEYAKNNPDNSKEEEKIKGGPNKGLPKRRGPGRPTK